MEWRKKYIPPFLYYAVLAFTLAALVAFYEYQHETAY